MNTNDTNRVPEPPKEVYPSAPLRAVALECHFAPMLDAHARFGTFQRRHVDDLPSVNIPEDGTGTSAPVLLLNTKASRGVAIAPSFVAVVTYSYVGGFNAFLEWAEPLLNEALDVLDQSRITAVTYRYENVIDYKSSVDEVVRIGVPQTPGAKGPARGLAIEWTAPWPGGEVEVELGSFGEPHSHLHLDITARRVGRFTRAGVAGALGEARSMGRLTFEALITPELRTRLREARS